MTRLIRNLAVRRKLQLIVMTTCGAALLLACGVFAAFDDFSTRAAVINDLGVEAEIVGGNSAAALSFRDEEAADVRTESTRSCCPSSRQRSGSFTVTPASVSAGIAPGRSGTVRRSEGCGCIRSPRCAAA